MLVTQLIPQKNWPIVEMMITALKKNGVSADSKIAPEKPPATDARGSRYDQRGCPRRAALPVTNDDDSPLHAMSQNGKRQRTGWHNERTFSGALSANESTHRLL